MYSVSPTTIFHKNAPNNLNTTHNNAIFLSMKISCWENPGINVYSIAGICQPAMESSGIDFSGNKSHSLLMVWRSNKIVSSSMAANPDKRTRSKGQKKWAMSDITLTFTFQSQKLVCLFYEHQIPPHFQNHFLHYPYAWCLYRHFATVQTCFFLQFFAICLTFKELSQCSH